MLSPYTRDTVFLIGEDQVVFHIHSDLLERTCTYFLEQPWCTVKPIPDVDPKVFQAFFNFLHGVKVNIYWPKEEDRITLVGLALIAQELGTVSLKLWIANVVLDETTMIDRIKYCPDFVALKKTYDNEITNETFFLRRLFVDCYAHIGKDNHFANLVKHDHYKILAEKMWVDFSDRCGEYRKAVADAVAKKQPFPAKFSMDYYVWSDPRVQLFIARNSRQGVEIFGTGFYGFNRIRIDDGKAPLLIHQSLIDTRGDILGGLGPHDILYPYGWRGAILIYLDWLYFGKVMKQTDNLKDLILAYCLDLPRTTHFQNAVISAIVSWCARYAIVPSDADITLAYIWTKPGSPLRSFLAAWATTHRAEDVVNLGNLPKDIREEWEEDEAHEYRLRAKSVAHDLHGVTAMGEWFHDRINGPCFWEGQQCMNESGLTVAPYYFDDVCKRFHMHDDCDDKRRVGYGGNGGKECQDFHGASDHLPCIIAYLPNGIEKVYREGWVERMEDVPAAVARRGQWRCLSDMGWPAYHTRMLLGNSKWLCRRCKDGIAYFVRSNSLGQVDMSHVDPRRIEWVRGYDPWGGDFPVVPSEITEYNLDDFFEKAFRDEGIEYEDDDEDQFEDQEVDADDRSKYATPEITDNRCVSDDGALIECEDQDSDEEGTVVGNNEHQSGPDTQVEHNGVSEVNGAHDGQDEGFLHSELSNIEEVDEEDDLEDCKDGGARAINT